jgi:hypothetical protein
MSTLLYKNSSIEALGAGVLNYGSLLELERYRFDLDQKRGCVLLESL